MSSKGTTNIPGVCVIIKKGGKILASYRSNTGFKDNEYCVPGGHVDPGETFKQAAAREAMEEVGLHIRPEDLVYKMTVHRNGAKDIRIDIWFEALAWTGEEKNGVPDEHDHIKWLDLDELPENFVDYMLFGITNIAEGNTYGEFGWN
ncbi:MAG TPA: NUDIX domain-containing protein [Verrucomicrobiae bacterium]|nr:NUDIX domain-containing protein [Verrucomicrobiae bacterium]